MIPTEPIGSIPRPLPLIQAMQRHGHGHPDLEPLYEFIPLAQLGTTDDCGFAPFCDDTSTSRDTAFAKISARVPGTVLAAHLLGV